MKALCWMGRKTVSVLDVPDPTIINPHDAIIKITSTAICGSDLHLYDGYIPTMMTGDILGHEFMGEVVAVGKECKTTKVGDRVVVPFAIACGSCFFCSNQLTSCCDNTNPNAALMEKAYGYAGSALFGYSHMMGGYAGGQAEFARVPFADFGPMKVPSNLTDEQVLFLTDIFPTGYMAAENCNIKPGDTVAVWGCGPVGLFAIKSAYMLGAHRVIGIDPVAGRRRKAAQLCEAEVVDPNAVDLSEFLDDTTAGRGPDACIDAVGLEAHGTSIGAVVDRTKAALGLATDRITVLRQAILACRKGGTVSIPGVYGGYVDHLPMGAAFGKGLTFKMGQTNVHNYLRPLLHRIEKGEIDPSFLITHRYALKDAAAAYTEFSTQQDECMKVVLKP